MASSSSSPRCAVRGSVNNDEYFYVNHISNPGETISSTAYRSRVGGKGANQSVAIARAGGQVDFYGTVGKDGLWVREKMREFLGGGEECILVDETVPIGRAIIQVAENGENSIVLFPGANFSTLHESKPLPPSSHLLLQNEIPLSSTLSTLHFAHERGTVTVFNPSPMPSDHELKSFPWKELNWLVVNEGEAEMLYQILGSGAAPKDPKVLLRELANIDAFHGTNIICTLGAQGVLAFLPHIHRSSSSPEPTFLPAAKLQGTVRDTTGAGDCFLGYFVAGLMELHGKGAEGDGIKEEDIKGVLRICVQAAGMCVEREGTIDSIPLRGEVEERLRLRASTTI